MAKETRGLLIPIHIYMKMKKNSHTNYIQCKSEFFKAIKRGKNILDSLNSKIVQVLTWKDQYYHNSYNTITKKHATKEAL